MAKQRESRWVKAVVSRIVRFVLWFVTKPDWKGTEHVPDKGGAIIALNHLSLADPLTVAHFLYIGARRWPTFTMKEGIMRIPVVSAVARSTGQIPVKRGSTDAVKALHEAELALTRDGASVIFYPEGTCTRDPDLWPMTAKTGVARLALTTGVPVVPVAHWGEQHIMPYGTKKVRLFPRKRVEFRAGPPVDLSRFRDQPLTGTVLREATEAIMADITGLQARIRGEEPPAVPYDPRKARTAAAGSEARPSVDGGTAAAADSTAPTEDEAGAKSDNGKDSAGA
ncbi:lysophospholipid acyltransferase family protein [Nocardiopsis synnemataformans]|uniref:lysophospholipid acyltransferase family protein n=1 Tax=Nocardiopsis synnemataformans TaxID=61305 RepID=UPI003EBE3FA2